VNTNLFKKSTFLDDVWDGLHLDAFRLVDVFEGVELTGLFVLDNTNLRQGQRMLTGKEWR